jgi:hypothetical protein
MSTSTDLVNLVRSIIDLDETDLPISLIRTYLRDGFDRIITLERTWPFLEVSSTFNTVAGQREYATSGITAGSYTGGTYAFREITSMVDNSISGNRLRLIALEDAERIWSGSLDTSARPMYFVEWGDIQRLYPKPDAVYSIAVRGFRKPIYNWVSDGTVEIDCDDRLHTAIAYYALSRAYQRQEDAEMAAVYKQSFDEGVMLARKEIMRITSHRPAILSGGFPYVSYDRWTQNLGRTLRNYHP